MNSSSVSGKNWIFKKFNNSDSKKYAEDYSLDEIVARLLAIRKKDILNIDLSQISVKAKTADGLDSVGKNEAIVAHVISTLAN